jgi:hypothetical protein
MTKPPLDQYVQVLNEYLLRSKDHYQLFIQLGLNVLNHVFRIIRQLSKNQIDIAAAYSKKAGYYYLEYIEQMKTSENNLNVLDAVSFVYSKTISQYREENQLDEPATISMVDIEPISNIILNWANSKINIEQRMLICQNHVSKYIHLENIEPYLELIKNVQTKIPMTFDKYAEFLEEFYKIVKKQPEIELLDRRDKTMNLFSKEYIEIYESKSMKQFVKWIIE